MRDRVLIDTSVWIAYLQGVASDDLARIVDDVLAAGEIIVPQVVLAELIQGARSEKDVSSILEFLEAFTIVGEGDQTWVAAGKLSYILKKRGRTVNLTDCYIATIAQEHKASLLTLDKHFKEIQKETGLKLHTVS